MPRSIYLPPLLPLVLLVAAPFLSNQAAAFVPTSTCSIDSASCVKRRSAAPALSSRSADSAGAATATSAAAAAAVEQTAASVTTLKKVLEREYISFFDPMEDSWYSPSVTFVDPMTELSGVDSYRNNVDMLAGRTLMGKILFEDAGINLYSVTGGEVCETAEGKVEIAEITTRWTLKVTASVLPWKPTARFTGISVYKVVPDASSSNGVQIVGQTDYWDSVNLQPNSGGQYQRVEKSLAIQDFLNQLKPGGPKAQAAAPELPYELLRRGDGYEVRRYPPYVGVRQPYKRRDEGFGSLGAFARGMDPLGPAIMFVENSDVSDKYMMWPLSYAMPGQEEAIAPQDAIEKAGDGQWRTMKIVSVPGPAVVAVRPFTDASMEPVVRNADRELRGLLERDGLVPKAGSEEMVRFAQYDAIFSMGQRRGEVWIELEEEGSGGGHPW
mmetsp:Transcript_17059/g.48985  ORF Transcript_17059/g.48985 Transcript_17059/m.48985 type:complete len:440 (-) Transcript_17059:185-1504(-)